MTFATRQGDMTAGSQPDHQPMQTAEGNHDRPARCGARSGRPTAQAVDGARQAQEDRADARAHGQDAQGETALRPSDWTRTLAAYRQPVPARSVFELTVTLVPFVAIWAVAWWLVSISAVLAMALALANAAFLVRLFIIQHDCGHGSLFRGRRLCDWIGRGLGVLTLTPYDVWRRTHAIHQATSGNLDRRGVGDVPTLTVRENCERGWLGRALYRLLRNPVILFGVVPFYLFFLQHAPLRDLLAAQARDAARSGAMTAATVFLGAVSASFLVAARLVALTAAAGFPVAALAFAALFAALALVLHLLGRAQSTRRVARIAAARSRVRSDIVLVTALGHSARPLWPLAAFLTAFVLARRM